MKRFASVLFTLFVFIPTLSFADNYRFVSGPQGGNWFVLGGAFSSYLSEAGLNTSSSTGGGVSNVININRRKADLGFTVGSLLGDAVKGKGKGKGVFKKKVNNTVVFANLYPQLTYFIARKDFVEDNNIKTLKDVFKVNKLKIASLKPGSSSEFIVSALLKLGYNQSWKTIKKKGGKIQFASYTDGADLIADGHIDIFAFSIGKAASVIMNIENQIDIVILPVDDNALQSLSNEYGTGTFYIEPGIYKSVKSRVPTVGDYTMVVIRKDMPNDIVTKMAETLLKNKGKLSVTIKDFSSFNANDAVSKTLPMHPAAKAFWRSVQ